MPNPIAMQEEGFDANGSLVEGPPGPITMGVERTIVTPVLGPVEAKINALTEVAKAARRFLNAVNAFEDSDYPSDAVTTEVAEAECELESLLETHAALIG